MSTPQSKRRVVVGISGASGSPYAARMLSILTEPGRAEQLDVSVVLSSTAEEVWAHECGGKIEDYGVPVYNGRDYSAPFASGSSCADVMVVIPCSMSCVARIAHGISDNLLTRAADVVLKERKSLILVPRETPYATLHLENMLSLSRSGATIMPASPSFYSKPESLDDIVDTVLGRVLDHMGIVHNRAKRWGVDISAEPVKP